MIRFTLLIMILSSFLSGSCSSRKSKLDRKGLIPEKELVSVLKDIYIADGLLSLPSIRFRYSDLDSLSAYISVIEKHGYSKETIDKTMKYYFVKNPKKLIAIYDQVLGIFSAQESLLEKEVLITQRNSRNLWTGREFYSFPDHPGIDSTSFNINLYSPGVYTLSFSATLFPDDQSGNPRFSAFTCHPDSIVTGERRYIKTLKYLKDGQPHSYDLAFTVPQKKYLHFKGMLYDFDSNPIESGKHAIFENISLVFSKVPR